MFEKKTVLAVVSFLRGNEETSSQQFLLGAYTNEELAIGNMLDWLASEESKKNLNFEEIQISDYFKTFGKEREGKSKPNFFLKRIFKGKLTQGNESSVLTYFLSVIPFEINKRTFMVNSGLLL